MGSKCGRVVLFDADLLQQQELVPLPTVVSAGGETSAEWGGKTNASLGSTKTSANALFKKAAAGTHLSLFKYLLFVLFRALYV